MTPTRVAVLVGMLVVTPSFTVQAASQSEGAESRGIQGQHQVTGTIERIASGQIEVNTGEVQPRYIPLNEAKEKGLPELKPGDRLDITLNDQNLIVDYHLADASGRPAAGSEHRIVKGRIAQPLVIGHDQAILRTEDGREEGFEIRSQARSKVASIPVGVDAVFLLDETNKIVDVTFEDRDALKRAEERPDKKSPIKGAHRRVVGTIVESPTKDQVTIRTADGKERPYAVRPLVVDKLTTLSKGELVVLLVDDENKVMDIAIPPAEESGKGPAR
ncbi:hypothetical protein [Candidatus Nitrospira bockiana]